MDDNNQTTASTRPRFDEFPETVSGDISREFLALVLKTHPAQGYSSAEAAMLCRHAYDLGRRERVVEPMTELQTPVGFYWVRLLGTQGDPQIMELHDDGMSRGKGVSRWWGDTRYDWWSEDACEILSERLEFSAVTDVNASKTTTTDDDIARGDKSDGSPLSPLMQQAAQRYFARLSAANGGQKEPYEGQKESYEVVELGTHAEKMADFVKTSDASYAHSQADEILRLREDNILMALALKGISPDRNTQTEAEADALDDLIEAAANRALLHA